MTTSSSEELIARMRKASVAIYLATDARVADDISGMLTRAAAALESAQADLAARDAVIAAVKADVDAYRAMSAEHLVTPEVAASFDIIVRDFDRILAQFPADALAAVKAEAWDEGWDTGFSSASHLERESVIAAEPLDKSVNPYRTTPTEGAGQ